MVSRPPDTQLLFNMCFIRISEPHTHVTTACSSLYDPVINCCDNITKPTACVCASAVFIISSRLLLCRLAEVNFNDLLASDGFSVVLVLCCIFLSRFSLT